MERHLGVIPHVDVHERVVTPAVPIVVRPESSDPVDSSRGQESWYDPPRVERRGVDDRRSAAAVPCPQRRQECGVARRPRSTLLPPRGPTSTPTRPFAAAAQLPWEAAIAEQVAETASMSTAMMGTNLNGARMTCLRGFSRCSGRPLDSGG
jgi:hypothetical protein